MSATKAPSLLLARLSCRGWYVAASGVPTQSDLAERFRMETVSHHQYIGRSVRAEERRNRRYLASQVFNQDLDAQPLPSQRSSTAASSMAERSCHQVSLAFGLTHFAERLFQLQA